MSQGGRFDLREILLNIAGLVEAGQAEKALAIFDDLLANVSHVAALWFKAADLADSVGEARRALEFRLSGLKLDPENEAALDLVMPTLRHERRFDEALELFEAALSKAPEQVAFLIGCGAILLDLDRPVEAEKKFKAAVEKAPRNPTALNNLGLVQSYQGRFQAGIPYFRRAVEYAPSYRNALLNLGAALSKTGQSTEAVEVCRRAVDLAPKDGAGWLTLGNALKLKGKLSEAREALECALKFGADENAVRYALGNVAHSQGDLETARAVLRDGDSEGLALREALLAPIIPKSEAEIDEVRAYIEKRLDELESLGIRLSPPKPETRFTNFLLAYHDRNDRPLQEKIANFYRSVCPSLNWTAPHCVEGREKGERIKIGIASAFLHGHTIGKLYGPLVGNLPREYFEVFLLRAGGQDDSMAGEIEKAADHVIRLSPLYLDARHSIAELELDALFYPDIGMDALTYFLAFSRLAPVQMTSLGHPMTTGLDTVDYFITAKTNEQKSISDHYTEEPVLLSRGPVFMKRPKTPKQPLARKILGLPEDKRLYVCPQSLFKFHPEFDRVLAGILREDPDGVLVLIGDHLGGSWQKILLERLQKSIPSADERVIFTRRLSGDEYMGLLTLADALLDIPQFSGGNSTLEAFACGAPIVTRPSAYMKGRLTDGFYREMGISGLSASSDQEYVALAVRLANDKEFHQAMSEKISGNAARLFDREDVLREFAEFVRQAVEGRQIAESSL